MLAETLTNDVEDLVLRYFNAIQPLLNSIDSCSQPFLDSIYLLVQAGNVTMDIGL